MDFNTIYTQLIGQIAMLGLIIGIVTTLIRGSIEKIIPRLIKNYFFQEIIVPAIPYLISIPISYISMKYGDKSITYFSGITAAAASSYLYRIFKSYLKIAQEKLEREAQEEADKEKKKDETTNPDIKKS